MLDTPSSQGSQGDLSAHSADTVWRAALQDIDDFIRTVADPNERVAAVTARWVEWLQADLQAREKTLDDGRFEAFLKSRLPSLRYEVHCACTKDPAEAPIERLLLHFWEELADFLRGSYLTEADRTRLESFLDRVSEERHKRYIELLVDTVRSRLRERARRGGATTSVVAQSVWQSFLDQDFRKVDLEDPNSAWKLLVEIVVRHVNKWDRRGGDHRVGGHRVGSVSLDEPTSSPEAETPQTLVDTIQDTREISPVDEAIYRESLLLVGEGDPRSGIFAQMLTPRQRGVFALRQAGKTRPEIASILGITLWQVDQAWKGIKDKGDGPLGARA